MSANLIQFLKNNKKDHKTRYIELDINLFDIIHDTKSRLQSLWKRCVLPIKPKAPHIKFSCVYVSDGMAKRTVIVCPLLLLNSNHCLSSLNSFITGQ